MSTIQGMPPGKPEESVPSDAKVKSDSLPDTASEVRDLQPESRLSSTTEASSVELSEISSTQIKSNEEQASMSETTQKAETIFDRILGSFRQMRENLDVRLSGGALEPHQRLGLVKDLYEHIGDKGLASAVLARHTLRGCEIVLETLASKLPGQTVDEALLDGLERAESQGSNIGKTIEFPIRWDRVPEKPTPPEKHSNPTVTEKRQYKRAWKEYTQKNERFYKVRSDVERFYAGCNSLEEKKARYEEAYQKFTDNFREGDLIFFKLDPKKFGVKSAFSKDDYIDYGILRGQGMAKAWMGGDKSSESNSFIHVGILVRNEQGRLCVAEATPGDFGDDVRIVDMETLALDSTSKQEFRVVRPTDESSRESAAHLAKTMAEEVDEAGKPVHSQKDPAQAPQEEGTRLKYTKSGAVMSLFGSSKMGKKARKAILLRYAEQQLNPNAPPSSKKGEEAFFCSYFVGYCLQQGKAQSEIEGILTPQELRELEQIRASGGDRDKLDAWASKAARGRRHEMEQKISFKFDPKYMSPQRLRAYIHSHPEQFENAARIVPSS